MNTPPLDPLGQMIAKYQSNGCHQLSTTVQSPSPITPQLKKKGAWIGFSDKTFWDWLNLVGVFLIPLMIGVFTIATTIQQSQIATDQQQAATLKAYLDDITDLMLNHGLRQSKPGDDARIVARAKTLTALRGLDGNRKGALIEFLFEANLISLPDPKVAINKANSPIITLHLADLKNSNLSGLFLYGADLHDTHLDNADFSNSILDNDNISITYLVQANFSNTRLVNADLSKSALFGANFSGANLKGALVTPEQLAQAKSLTNATLPDGSKYPSKTYPIPNTKNG